MLKDERIRRLTKAGVAALLLFAAIVAGNYLPTPIASENYFQIPSTPSRDALRTVPGHDYRSADQDIDAQIQQDIDGAVEVVNQYWVDHWTFYFVRDYEPPTIAGGFEGMNGPICYGEPLRPMNIYYCPEGDYIVWDSNFFRSHYANGNSQLIPYILIAHEWGHAIQWRLDAQYSTNAPELQADCLAGLALYGAERDGTLQLENGAGNEMAMAYAAISDDTPWSDSTSHGDAVDRMAAFTAGRSGDIDACIPYDCIGLEVELRTCRLINTVSGLVKAVLFVCLQRDSKRESRHPSKPSMIFFISRNSAISTAFSGRGRARGSHNPRRRHGHEGGKPTASWAVKTSARSRPSAAAASNAWTAAGAVAAIRMSPSASKAPSTSSAVPSPWFGRGRAAQFLIGRAGAASNPADGYTG
jgi:predicted metalloprotease